MAHEVEQMFSVIETPWHGLGRVIEKAPNVEAGIALAGLDWQVGLKALQTEDGETVTHRASYRKDTGAILGVVGPSWTPLQNAEAFRWFQPLLDAGLANLETAGSLREGRRVWVLARINLDPITIVAKAHDDVEGYLLLSNSHDGSLAVRVGFTPIRVVCANTLAFAHDNEASKLLKVMHTGRVAQNLEAIRETIDLAAGEFRATAEHYRQLATKGISQADLEKYVRRVFTPSRPDDDKRAAKKIIPRVTALFEQGRGNDLPGVKGTAWAAYNAVTEYLGYERGKDQGQRLDSLWFGEGHKLNATALERALELV